MSNVSMETLKTLREQTGVGLGKCKEALTASDGDLEQALLYLRKTGLASAGKKEGRETNEGVIKSFETPLGISVVEISVETDFVAKNEKFLSFAESTAKDAALSKANSVESLLSSSCSHDASLTVDQHRALLMQALGENIQIKRVKFFNREENSSIGVYSHGGGKVVSIVAIQGSSEAIDVAKSVAMHVAASSPEFLSKNDIPEAIIEKEKDVARAQMSGKPEAIINKILEGKLQTFFAESCLLNQQFIKDASLSVEEFLQSAGKASSTNLFISWFIRWKVGA